MNTADKKHAKALQDALLSLDPSGPEGFEGLLGVVLGEVTGQSFRLAKSGTQRGRDGDSAFDGGATYFEGKRYKEGLSKNDISTKLFDVANDDTGVVDLWILGATCEVASQTVEDGRKFSARNGFGFTVLDWSNNDLGALLVATVVAGSKSKAIIEKGLAGKLEAGLIAPALKAIDHFEKHGDYPSRLSALRQSLTTDAGLGHAKTLNQEWLSRLFTDKVQARAEFGQPLAPFDPSGPSTLDRPELAFLTKAFSGVPESEIYAIVGEEGVGKSWLAVQSWNLSNPKSLLVLCPADDLTGDDADDFDDFLIRKLIYQTDGSATPQVIARWRRRFKDWRTNIPASSVRVTLIADGLNQPLKSNWGRWLDRAARRLKELGGCLVVTTRKQHWAYLKKTLFCELKTITLAEWSINDVKQILGSCGIDFSNTRIEVLESVRNPRLLGIAIELIKAKAIELLDELSVGRLLFEHMRRMEQHGAAKVSAPAFADLLKNLAGKVLARANAQNTDDLRLFDAIREAQLEAVASSRFFSPVKGSASQFEIKRDGLNLALALYLVSQLERELRNERDPREKLATILEPISALDETAKVILLATQIACLEDETSPEIRSALIEEFVSLQNLPNSQADAFAVLAKSAPLAFLQAAENVYLSQEHIASKEWLLYALLNRRGEPGIWQHILESTKRWLSFYSLEPERGMHRTTGHGSAIQVDEEHNRVLEKIQERQATLTEVERSFMNRNLIIAPHPRFDDISRFALYLLAGMPLKEIATYFIRWRFSAALNSSTLVPYEEFEQVLHYNRVDWLETRSEILKGLEALPAESSSSVGAWTRVGILYGTGDVSDAKEGARIRSELTRDQERFEGWSIKQTYSAADPCNPDTVESENVIATAQNYRQIDPEKIAISRGMSQEDHYFRGARASVARFVPDDAIQTHRAFASEVLSRSGQARLQGILMLLRHSAALTKDLAQRFLSASESSNASYKGKQEDRDEFFTAQFSAIIALPHFTADEQLEAIAKMQSETLLLELLSCVRSATPDKVEQVLECVLQCGNEYAQAAVLASIHYSKSPLTPRAVEIVKSFIRSPLKNLRHVALALAGSHGDITLLQEVIDSGWSTEKPNKRGSSFEEWYGSTAILKALEVGLIDTDSALARINVSHYGFAAEILSVEHDNAIAARIEAALMKALDFEWDKELPEIETVAPTMSDLAPALVSLTERAMSENDFISQMNRLSETQEQFDERRRRMNSAYELFADELTAVEADLILSDLTFDGIKSIIGQDAGRDQRCLHILVATSDQKLRHLHHFAVQVAVALGASGNPLALGLINRILALDPTIRHVTGAAKIPVETIVLWNNITNLAIGDICRRRLRAPQNDSDIAREVIAAHLCGKVAILQTYIDELLATDRPYETALALMIAGFCDNSAHAEAVLSRFDGTEGFIGKAHLTASDSYARNLWAKTWYVKMLNAQRQEDFWRASVLFMKIVDGRFDIWPEASIAPTAIFTAFMPTISREISKRAIKIQKKRQEKLFGEKTPSSIILRFE
ncbi:hypothetical protein EE896_05130 [Pantoea eucalypti]|uniref:NACHT domain-containing protein n=1 Tax=Pantoea eucalypti TaxID=470933 RepID=A0ABY2ZSK7_9GAMM|nr:hypothetical protein [Pantoea eucalypti]QGF26264.1 hypothetical protein EE896_05130 [Pantoea eucalypti]TPV40002.1 hypothetical protein FJW02_05045 [Pantoea eucalypti]